MRIVYLEWCTYIDSSDALMQGLDVQQTVFASSMITGGGGGDLRWAEKFHKPNGPGAGEFRNKHGTKRDPHGQAAVAGSWANKVVTAHTRSDPLNGLKNSRTQHD